MHRHSLSLAMPSKISEARVMNGRNEQNKKPYFCCIPGISFPDEEDINSLKVDNDHVAMGDPVWQADVIVDRFYLMTFRSKDESLQ